MKIMRVILEGIEMKMKRESWRLSTSSPKKGRCCIGDRCIMITKYDQLKI
jgi:hypothetical protein